MPVLSLDHWSTNIKVTMTSILNVQPSPYFFLSGFNVTFSGALGTFLRMPLLHYIILHYIILYEAGWPGQPRVMLFTSLDIVAS